MAVAVPKTSPVAVFKVNPVGRLGLTEKLKSGPMVIPKLGYRLTTSLSTKLYWDWEKCGFNGTFKLVT
jgi:hypothetical protein